MLLCIMTVLAWHFPVLLDEQFCCFVFFWILDDRCIVMLEKIVCRKESLNRAYPEHF